MNARVLAALAALVLGIVAAWFLRSPEPTVPAPAGPPAATVSNETVDMPDVAPGSSETLVQVSELPQGWFVLARLTDSLDEVETNFNERLPTVRAASEGLGLSPRGEALVILDGSWETDTVTFLALPVAGEPEEERLRAQGLRALFMEGGDGMSIELDGPDYPGLLQKTHKVLQNAAEADGNPVGGITLVQLDTSAEGKRVIATLSVMGPEDQPQL